MKEVNILLADSDSTYLLICGRGCRGLGDMEPLTIMISRPNLRCCDRMESSFSTWSNKCVVRGATCRMQGVRGAFNEGCKVQWVHGAGYERCRVSGVQCLGCRV